MSISGLLAAPWITQIFIFKIEKPTPWLHLNSSTIYFLPPTFPSTEKSTLSLKYWSAKPKSTHIEETIIHTFAIRLALRYLIMRSHPAINAMPNTIPMKIPEIKPIFPDSKDHLFPFQHKKHKPKNQKPKHPHEKKHNFLKLAKQHQSQAKNETFSGIWEKYLKGSHPRG